MKSSNPTPTDNDKKDDNEDPPKKNKSRSQKLKAKIQKLEKLVEKHNTTNHSTTITTDIYNNEASKCDLSNVNAHKWL